MIGIRPGDIVRYEKSGVRSLGVVVGKAAGVLDVVDVPSEQVASTIKVRQVTELFRRVRA